MGTIFQVLTLAWSLQGGVYGTNATQLYSSREVSSPFFIDTEFEIQLPFSFQKGGRDIFFIGAETESQFFPLSKIIGFQPWQDTYKFNAGIRFWGIEIAYQHECIHPVVTSGENGSYYFAAYDKISAKIAGTF